MKVENGEPCKRARTRSILRNGRRRTVPQRYQPHRRDSVYAASTRSTYTRAWVGLGFLGATVESRSHGTLRLREINAVDDDRYRFAMAPLSARPKRTPRIRILNSDGPVRKYIYSINVSAEISAHSTWASFLILYCTVIETNTHPGPRPFRRTPRP